MTISLLIGILIIFATYFSFLSKNHFLSLKRLQGDFMLSFTKSRPAEKKLAIVFCFFLFTTFGLTFGNECSIRSDSTNSFNEVFPLIRNLQYIYEYRYEEKFIDMIVPVSGRIDSGFVEYTILDSSIMSDSSAIWNVREISVTWRKEWVISGDTSIELIVDTLVFPLQETNFGNHQLWMSGIVWDFPIYDPVQPIYRYADSTSVLITRNWNEIYDYGRDTIKMSVAEGFFYRSLSARIGSMQNGTSIHLKINLLHPPTVGVMENEQDIQSFSLKQNYPNPFNPSTVISFQLKVSENVTLKVFDVLGKEIATLVDEEKPAGSYDVEFDAAQLPSGVYFYQLKAGEFAETKKMVILK